MFNTSEEWVFHFIPHYTKDVLILFASDKQGSAWIRPGSGSRRVFAVSLFNDHLSGYSFCQRAQPSPWAWPPHLIPLPAQGTCWLQLSANRKTLGNHFVSGVDRCSSQAEQKKIKVYRFVLVSLFLVCSAKE